MKHSFIKSDVHFEICIEFKGMLDEYNLAENATPAAGKAEVERSHRSIHSLLRPASAPINVSINIYNIPWICPICKNIAAPISGIISESPANKGRRTTAKNLGKAGDSSQFTAATKFYTCVG